MLLKAENVCLDRQCSPHSQTKGRGEKHPGVGELQFLEKAFTPFVLKHRNWGFTSLAYTQCSPLQHQNASKDKSTTQDKNYYPVTRKNSRQRKTICSLPVRFATVLDVFGGLNHCRLL